MNQSGPIIVIEDDQDDLDILAEIFQTLNCGNQVIFFTDGTLALEYLMDSKEKPFIIISDINMPKLTGFELKDKIENNEKLRSKCIPYLFLTTAASQRAVIDAYSKSVQGFFVKPGSYTELENTIRRIIEYWKECRAPNSVS